MMISEECIFRSNMSMLLFYLRKIDRMDLIPNTSTPTSRKFSQNSAQLALTHSYIHTKYIITTNLHRYLTTEIQRHKKY